MIRTNLFQNTAAHEIVFKDGSGRYSLLEYKKDLSVTPGSAVQAYFAAQMNVRKRQVIIELNNDGGVTLQAGAMQMMMGKISAKTNVKGAGDLMKKMVGGKMTGESAIKPLYKGIGILVLEPTYKYILFEKLDNWGDGMVIEDGLFLACDESINIGVVARTNVSSTLLGGEGMFNSCLSGHGTAVLESPVPPEELLIVDVDNDVLKIDGSMAIAWSNSLDFTVERVTKTLVGSAASGEGLVNVYRGSGRVLVAPVGD